MIIATTSPIQDYAIVHSELCGTNSIVFFRFVSIGLHPRHHQNARYPMRNAIATELPHKSRERLATIKPTESWRKVSEIKYSIV